MITNACLALLDIVVNVFIDVWVVDQLPGCKLVLSNAFVIVSMVMLFVFVLYLII